MTIRKLIRLMQAQSALNWAAIGLVLPVQFRLFYAMELSLFQIGVMVAGFSAVVILLELPTGALADQLGRRKLFLTAQGFSLLGVVALLLGEGFAGYGTAYLLWGVGAALSSGTLDAWFVERHKALYRAEPEQPTLHQALAQVGVATTLALGVACTLGAMLPVWSQQLFAGNVWFDTLPTPFHFNIWLSLLVTPLCPLFVWLFIEESRDDNAPRSLLSGLRNTPRQIKAAFGLLEQSALRLLLLPLAMVGFGFEAVEYLWQPALTDLLADPIAMSAVFALAGGGYFLAKALGGQLSSWLGSRFSPTALMIWSWSGCALAVALTGWQSDWEWFVALFLSALVLESIATPAHSSLYQQQIPDQQRSTLSSLSSMLLQLGGMAGSLALGAMADWLGMGSAYTLAGAILALGLIPLLRFSLTTGAQTGAKAVAAGADS